MFQLQSFAEHNLHVDTGTATSLKKEVIMKGSCVLTLAYSKWDKGSLIEPENKIKSSPELVIIYSDMNVVRSLGGLKNDGWEEMAKEVRGEWWDRWSGREHTEKREWLRWQRNDKSQSQWSSEQFRGTFSKLYLEWFQTLNWFTIIQHLLLPSSLGNYWNSVRKCCICFNLNKIRRNVSMHTHL